MGFFKIIVFLLVCRILEEVISQFQRHESWIIAFYSVILLSIAKIACWFLYNTANLRPEGLSSFSGKSSLQDYLGRDYPDSKI